MLEQFGSSPVALGSATFDLVVGAVKHDDYRGMDAKDLTDLLAPGGTLADIKAMWRGLPLPPHVDYWTL